MIQDINTAKQRMDLDKNELNLMLSEFQNKNKIDLSIYERVYKKVLESTSLIGEKDGWKTEKGKNGRTLSFKNIPNTKTVAFKLEYDCLEVDFIGLAAIIYEIDLYPTWFPFCKDAGQVKLIDNTCKVVRIKLDFPFISEREMHLYGIGVNRTREDGSLIIMNSSIDTDQNFCNELGIQIPESKCVKMITIFYFCDKTYRRTAVSLSVLCNIDLQIKFIPESTMNMMTKKFSTYFFEKIFDKCRKYKGSQWETNVKDNPSFYGWMQDQIDFYFKQNPQL